MIAKVMIYAFIELVFI